MPSKVALVCGAKRLTYGELDRRANAIAHALINAGVERGDRVLILSGNIAEAVVSFWAVLKANAVVCLLGAGTRSDKLVHCLNDCRPRALIVEERLSPVVRESLPDTHHPMRVFSMGEHAETGAPIEGAVSWAEALAGGAHHRPPPRSCLDVDLAAIIYTSGSTGDSRGVMLSHRNMLTAARSISTYLELRAEDVLLCALPLSFDYGLYQVILAFQVGARVVLERNFALPVHALKVIAQERVTGLPGVPTMFAMLSELRNLRDFDLSSIRFVTSTAAALPLKHITLLRHLFPVARIYSMYGLTECKRCTYLPPKDLGRKPGSVGIAIPNTELWIVDEQGRRVGPNTVGQLVVRGATVMQGYWERPKETAERLRPGPLPGERVLYTGDLCRFDDEGYLYFVGRMDDVIKSRGEKVPPKEVESVIMNIAGVKEAAVVGVPDETLGQAVKAFVVLESGVRLGAKEVLHACQRSLETFMIPRAVEFVRELPHTASGKIKKKGLS